VDIAHSKALADDFAAAGVSVAQVDQGTPEEGRARIFQAYAEGKIRLLCSVGVLSLGFDQTSTACVILARPTLSLALHIQQIGRGLRRHPGKQDCLIFDHALNIQRHDRAELFEYPDSLDEVDRNSDRKRRSDDLHDYRPCPACRAIMEPRQRICHECGHEISRPTLVDYLPARLSEEPEETTPDPDKIKRTYLELLWLARNTTRRDGSRYSDGWAWHKARERYRLSEDEAKRLIPYRWRDLEPIPPSGETQRWLQSRQIAYHKATAGLQRRRAGV
jgi:DNA repair protein RadD